MRISKKSKELIRRKNNKLTDQTPNSHATSAKICYSGQRSFAGDDVLHNSESPSIRWAEDCRFVLPRAFLLKYFPSSFSILDDFVVGADNRFSNCCKMFGVRPLIFANGGLWNSEKVQIF